MAVDVLKLDLAEQALRPFLDLPRTIYRNDPHYTAPFRASVVASLGRPEFLGRQQALVSMEGGAAVARLVARVSPVLEDEDGRPIGMISFFEALDRMDGVRPLFAAALAWLRDQGANTVVGPMDGDTWHRYRLSVGPFEEPPFLMEPYNPSYYPALFEACGFGLLEKYYSLRVDDADAAARALAPRLNRVLDAGYRLETLRKDRFEKELTRIHRLSRTLFRGNFLFSDIDQESFLQLYAGSKSLIDDDLVLFAVAPDGRDAGFLFSLLDRQRAVKAMRGSTSLLAKLRFFLLKDRVDTLNLKSLGVLEEHRRIGLGAALMHCAYARARDRGLAHVNLCLIKQDNPSGRLDGGLGRQLRRYHLYRFAGDAS